MTGPADESVRWGRVAPIALALIIANAGWIAHSEVRNRVTEITITPLFIGVLFVHFVTTLLNRLVLRWRPGAALRPAELMAIFACLSTATALAGIGNIGFLLPASADPWWFGPVEQWGAFLEHLPAVVGPRDQEALRAFFLGNRSILEPGMLRPWAAPLVWWSALFLSLAATTLGLARLVLRRWADGEHLTFPTLALPLELARRDTPLLRTPLFWIGFLFPVVLHSLNSIASLYPSVPAWPINSFKQGLDGIGRPWSGLGSVPVMVHPGGVGTGFLVQTDVLFSLLFFWLLKRLLNLWGTSMGWRDAEVAEYGDGKEQFPFTPWQAWGAWLALGAGVLLAALRHCPNDPGARRSLVLVGSGFLAACGLVWAVGAPWWVPPVWLGIVVLLMLAIARLQSETPVMSMMLAWVFPQNILIGLFGSSAFSKEALVAMGVLGTLSLDYRAALLPQQVAGLAAAERSGGRPRAWMVALGLAALAGVAAAIFWNLDLYHRLGAGTAQVNPYRINAGKGPWKSLAVWWTQPTAPLPHVGWGMAFGAAVTWLLGFLRARFVGFPLAPAGYVLNTTFAHEHYWMDMAIAYLCKVSLLRFGGMRAYRTALPFFLGLLLGDFSTGAFWTCVAAWLGVPIFRTFPN